MRAILILYILGGFMKKTLIITSLFFLLLLGWLLLPVDAVEDANNQVIVESITQLTFNGTGGYRQDWSPDGGKIVFEKWDENGTGSKAAIWVVNSDGTNLKQLTLKAKFDFTGPKWSHNGKKILFYTWGNDSKVWLMDSDGSNPKELFNGYASAWTPDDRIAFVRNSSGANELVTVNIDGTDERKILPVSFEIDPPVWSPDGTKIAISDSRSGNWDIFVINADGSNERQLTGDLKDEWNPSWSPDGTKIVYHKFIQRHFDEKGNPKGDDFDIMVMNSDGSNKIKLNIDVGFQAFPSWSPDGRKIAFFKNGIWVMNLKSSEMPAPATPASKSTPSFESLLAIASIGAALLLRKR